MALVPHKELGCIFIAAVCTAVVRLKANKLKDYEISVSSCLCYNWLVVYFQPLQTEPVDLSVKKSSPSHWYEDMGEPENEAAANLRLGFRGLSYIKKGKSMMKGFNFIPLAIYCTKLSSVIWGLMKSWLFKVPEIFWQHFF